MNSRRLISTAVNPIILAVAIVSISGCWNDPETLLSPFSTQIESENPPPSDLVDVPWNGETLRLWPYTGANLSGDGEDPVSLIFVGKSDLMGIRAALLSLDGNRSAFGFPPIAPFDATWSDAIGDVQTNYSEEGGWTGSIVQLQLGNYGPLRVHLRLFQTDKSDGPGGNWTIGAAHFELVIPGTPEHQVLSWELAEKVVVADLMRSGLLATAPTPTAMINDAPSFREIPAPIYNGLPDGLKQIIGGPAGQVTNPVPIPSDGRGTILDIGQQVPVVAQSGSQAFTIQFQQFIPKPFCSEGPGDFVQVVGPINLSKSIQVTAEGRYQFSSEISGTVTVTPVDITQMPPQPIGDSYQAQVRESQNGFLSGKNSFVKFSSERIAPREGGTEFLKELLIIGDHHESFRADTHCRPQA